ncbi:hypothetical protein IMAU80627_02053 [Lactobacillus helveticus]|uniref:hypothetical protein n=2 Tax=Lactobacillus helveticus TaxID=1587 RepID=UPI001562B7E5|nr:hypothetical protein [Lactobacillus helveticus]NRN73496.1 hypothetical protein [Lactobacillus helveticus]
MADIVEQTLLEQQNIDLNEMVTMNQMIDELLPNASKDLQQKLKIKIYNYVRTRKQPSITVRRRKYFKPQVAKLIVENVRDYADAIERRAEEEPEAAKKAKNKKKTTKKAKKAKKAKTITKKKIFEAITKGQKIEDSIQEQLDNKLTSIVKANFIKPVNKRGSYSDKDGKKIIAELGAFYQSIKDGQKIREVIENEKANKEQAEENKQQKKNENNKNKKNENNKQTSNNNQNKHPFEIRKEKHENRSRNNQNNNRRNNRNNYEQLERRFNELQDKYNQALDDKARLLNEKDRNNDELKKSLVALLKNL